MDIPVEGLIVIGSALSTTLTLGVCAFLARNLIIERLRLSLQKEHSAFLDEIQWERKTIERAERVSVHSLTLFPQ